MATGKITAWKNDRGFGFVLPDTVGEDELFVHISQFQNEIAPRVGDKVSYRIGDNRGRPCAVDCEVL